MVRAQTVPPHGQRPQGRPPRGADEASMLAAICAALYLREWKTTELDLHSLYASPQLRAIVERYFTGAPDAADRGLLLLRRWFARHCGERAVGHALALGRGGALRQARVAARILVHRLDHPDLTRTEEAAAVGHALGLHLDPSAHRRAVDTMFDAMRRHGPELLRDLAWKSPERWGHYEARYGLDPAPPPAGTSGDAELGVRGGVARDLCPLVPGQSGAFLGANETTPRDDSPVAAPKYTTQQGRR